MTQANEPKNPMPQAGDAAVPTADAGEAVSHLGQDDAEDAARDREQNKSQGGTKPPPRQPGGIASGLQPGGMAPGGGPGASVGSIGTGGGPTGGAPSGSAKKTGV